MIVLFIRYVDQHKKASLLRFQICRSNFAFQNFTTLIEIES